MEFRILGPLEVADEAGRLVDLGRPKQRALLAVLVISANRVVPIDRLVDLLWGEDVPGRATGALHAYVSNLRRALEPQRAARAAAQLLVTQPPGYRLSIEPGQLDAARFADLAARGHRDLVEGRPRAAHEGLTEALAMWRGPALVEFASEPFATLEAARLEEARSVADEDRLEAELAIGQHAQVVGQLEVAVARSPLRERLWELLVLALYRSGRQGEALGAYERARHHLAEELGIDPSPSLRRLEADILAQSPALDWRPPPEEVGQEPLAAPVSTERPAPGPALVGRDAELGVLLDAFADARVGRGGLVLVRGEAGIGKTRLAEELAARAAVDGAVVVWGRAYESEGAPPFWPWVQIVRALLDGDDPEALVDALRPAASDLAQLVPEVKDVVGELPPPPALDPAAARFRFYEAATAFLSRLATTRRPLVLILDDLHWADPPSRQLTVHLVAQLKSTPMLVIATYRDPHDGDPSALAESLGALTRLPRVSWLSLTGLGEAAVERYLTDARGSTPTREEVASLRARTEGNPFFVAELVRLLDAEGATSDAAFVPAGVRDVIRRRLARLPRPTTDLLLLGAASGRDFDLRVVAAAADMGLDDAIDAVEPAVLNGIVAEGDGDPGGYRFSHALVRDTIYAGVAGLRRAGLHARVAEAIAAGPHADAQLTQMAHHFAEAVPTLGPDPAFSLAVRAAQAAQAGLAYEAAEDHLRRALAMVELMPSGRERDERELHAVISLATLLTVTRSIADAETGDAWARATELGRLIDDPTHVVRALWGVLVFAMGRADLDAAAEVGRQLAEAAGECGDPSFAAAGHLAQGGVAMLQGRLEEARRFLEQGRLVCDAALELPATQVVYTDLPVSIYGYLAMVLSILGEATAAAELSQAMIARATQLAHPFTLVLALLFDTVVGTLTDDVPLLRLRSDDLLSLAREQQIPDFVHGGQVTQGWLLAHGGDAAGGLAIISEAIAGMRTTGQKGFFTMILGQLADVNRRAGRPDDALAVVEEALGMAEATGQRFYEAELHRMRGGLLADLGRQDEAMTSLRRAVEVAGAQGAGLFRERADDALARLGGTGVQATQAGSGPGGLTPQGP